jgi:maleate isomerase
MEVYGVKAQMLVGLEAADGEVIGWISVHYVPGTRKWTDAEIAALQGAAGQVRTILQRSDWASFK